MVDAALQGRLKKMPKQTTLLEKQRLSANCFLVRCTGRSEVIYAVSAIRACVVPTIKSPLTVNCQQRRSTANANPRPIGSSDNVFA